MTGVARTPRSSLARRVRTAAAAVCLVALAACASGPARDDTADAAQLLKNSLPVAAAALAAGQLDVARRLYRSLADRFDDAPEPLLGLGYIAFQGGDVANAEKFFLQAAQRDSAMPAIRAEALLGAGRAALVQERTRAARRYFRNARESGRDTPSAAWIANGLAVVATLHADYEPAEEHYVEALRLSSGHPRILANYVRMLMAAGRIDDAAHAYGEHPPTYWADGDGPALARLVEDARRDLARETPASPRAGAPDESPDASPAQAGTAPERAAGRTPLLAPSEPAPIWTEPEDTDFGPPPRLLDTRLALRTHVSAQPDADAALSTGAGPAADSADLVLRLHRWPDARAPTPAMDDITPLELEPIVLGASSARSVSAPGASRPGAPEPASGLVVPAPDAPAPVPDAPALASGGAPAEASGAPAEASNAAVPASHPDGSPSAPARPHPVPESEEPAVAMLEHPSAGTLALLLGQSGRLHLDHAASSVLVASPEIADVRLLAPDVLYVIGKGVGRTSVAVLDDDERIDEWVVSVALDLEPLRAVLAADPDLVGVRARRLTRGAALAGEVVSSAVADRALRLAAAALPEGVPLENDLRVAAPQQVNLEVQIAEVQRSVTEDLGVNWESFGIRNSTQFGFRIGRLASALSEGGLGPGVFSPVAFGGNLASSVFLGSEGSRGQFRAMIDALATAGLANVLARPNVTAVSGESASFFSGGEFPLPTGFDDGVLIFEYKKYGVLLDFVPTVVDSGRIVLTVRPEVSEPSLNESVTIIQGVDVPVINVRRAETTVEVADGESIVIAGLFRNRTNTVESGVPVIKDVPLLGALFGYTSARANELELIVVVTARLVEPYTDPGDTGEPPATLQANGYHY